MGCPCKYGCCAVCSYSICYGVCCSAPPPTCGCGEYIPSGETCLNTSYYLYNTGYSDYFYFKFGYVLYVPDDSYDISMNDSLKQFMQYYYDTAALGLDNWVLTTDKNDVDGYSQWPYCQNYAQNCFIWQSQIVQNLPPFTPYGNTSSNCDTLYPETIYPCSVGP